MQRRRRKVRCKRELFSPPISKENLVLCKMDPIPVAMKCKALMGLELGYSSLRQRGKVMLTPTGLPLRLGAGSTPLKSMASIHGGRGGGAWMLGKQPQCSL